MTGSEVRADVYFPDYGDASYDVLHYDLRLDYRIERNHLAGRAELRGVAREDVALIKLDLHGLSVSKVRVDVVPVANYEHKRGKLLVRTRKPIAAGQEFRIAVQYGGKPRPVSDGSDGMGWEELADGVLVAGQTNGAPSWFPCNDRPSNKASYRIEVTVASRYHVVANGQLVSRHRGSGSTTWVHEQPEPMATYLATVQIGAYVAREVPDAPVPMTAVLPGDRLDDYEAGFGRQADMMAFFIDAFGPYPFGSYTAVITEDELEIPLEAQGLAIFGSNFLTDDWDSVRLGAHEMAHQWFGNSVTAETWRDIWLHEGFACYAEWLWSEQSGGPTAHEQAVAHWQTLGEKPQDLVLGDPGPDDMFDDRVYKRGALLLHAVRAELGDDTFFALLREWTGRHRHGSVTTQMFVDLAEELAGRPLGTLFTEWLSSPELPGLP
ncbi:MAG: M1 family metallopeptidase [Nocardioides sp.]